jgi:hypothetical protein
MPLILAPSDYARWLNDERDPVICYDRFRRSLCGCAYFDAGQ